MQQASSGARRIVLVLGAAILWQISEVGFGAWEWDRTYQSATVVATSDADADGPLPRTEDVDQVVDSSSDSITTASYAEQTDTSQGLGGTYTVTAASQAVNQLNADNQRIFKWEWDVDPCDCDASGTGDGGAEAAASGYMWQNVDGTLCYPDPNAEIPVWLRLHMEWEDFGASGWLPNAVRWITVEIEYGGMYILIYSDSEYIVVMGENEEEDFFYMVSDDRLDAESGSFDVNFPDASDGFVDMMHAGQTFSIRANVGTHVGFGTTLGAGSSLYRENRFQGSLEIVAGDP